MSVHCSLLPVTDTSPIQLETLCPIHIGNKCSAAAKWPGRQPMLSSLLSRRCPFRCEHEGTDDGTRAHAVLSSLGLLYKLRISCYWGTRLGSLLGTWVPVSPTEICFSMSPKANRITLCDATTHQLTLLMRLYSHFRLKMNSTLLHKCSRLLKLKVRVLVTQMLHGHTQ